MSTSSSIVTVISEAGSPQTALTHESSSKHHLGIAMESSGDRERGDLLVPWTEATQSLELTRVRIAQPM